MSESLGVRKDSSIPASSTLFLEKIQLIVTGFACCGTFDGDAGGDGGLPLPMAAPGHPDLVGDVVAGLTEEVDAALLGETPARRRLAAEAAMFGHQWVGAVAQSACEEKKQTLR